MAQITSRKELMEWLKDKPADWAQVIAVRLALRVLPYAFPKGNFNWGEETIKINNQDVIFRSSMIIWARCIYPIHKWRVAAESASVGIELSSAAAQHSSINAQFDLAEGNTPYGWQFEWAKAAEGIAYAMNAIARSLKSGTAIIVGFGIPERDMSQLWESVACDYKRMDVEPEGDLSSLRIMQDNLWPLGEPEDIRKAWQHATNGLLALDPTYQVWIDWYNRRIEGHTAAFDIPGDTDRTEDKKILARLADATDEDFWGKGATYVNTTLQNWIDEARERAAIDYVTSGAPLNLGSDAELTARDELASRLTSIEDALAALKDQLASLTQTGHGGIGHNQPENATSLRDDEIITLKQQVASLETLLTGVQTQLAIPVPDVGQLVQDVPKLNRWGRAMCVMADMSSDKVAEGFEKEIGAASARGLINVGKALVYTALCAFLLFFYTVWIPLLIG